MIAGGPEGPEYIMAPLSTDRHTGKRGVKTALSRLHASLTRAHRQMLQPRYGIYPALGLLVVGVLALAYQRSDLSNKQEETRRTELERIRSRGMATDSARAAYGAAMVAALAPTALSGNRLQRRRALQALAAAAPTSAADLAGVIFETSTSAEEKEFARQINMRASLDEMDRRFMGHIRVARELHHERFFVSFRQACVTPISPPC